jgi:hypothetical protein
MSNQTSKASSEAMAAVRAAKNIYKWGRYATDRFVNKRCTRYMYTLALLNEIDMELKKKCAIRHIGQ